MPSGSPLPSPMALSRTPTSSIFKKKPPQPASAASYLSALSQADARARGGNKSGAASISTPALSLSSSVTSSSAELETIHDGEDADGLTLPVRPPTSEEVYTTLHTEFGHSSNEAYRYVSQHTPGAPVEGHVEQNPPYYILLSTYISYLILICLGHVRDFIGKRTNPSSYRYLVPRDGYAPLNSDFDSFYTRRLKTRMDECFNQPVTGVAGRTIMLLDRYSVDYNQTQILSGTQTRALNISSYNYLGFAQASGGCADAVEECINRYGVSSCGARMETGTNDLHVMTEKLVAQFVGMEDALVCSMGFATNSTYIPALVGKGCLVISDELNHASIRFGVRLSGADVRMFKHNDMENFENLLREVISQGQPKTHRPWKKILVLVEGLYSMEGTLVNLPQIVELKKKYKFYLFIDEAHSIGALGPSGRGVCDYFGISPRSVDILMGTFTKSFGAAGGYISGNKDLIDRLRLRGHSGTYAESMSPAVCTQILASMASIMGIAEPQALVPYVHPAPAPSNTLPTWILPTFSPPFSSGLEGNTRLRRLAFNSKYLHRGLKKLGFITYGHPSSPIVPLLLFNPGKMILFHRMMKDRGFLGDREGGVDGGLKQNGRPPIVVVVVAYPATPLVTSRVRFCVSAAHTKDDIDVVLRAVDEIGVLLDLKHGLSGKERWGVEEVVSRAVELVNM